MLFLLLKLFCHRICNSRRRRSQSNWAVSSWLQIQDARKVLASPIAIDEKEIIFLFLGLVYVTIKTSWSWKKYLVLPVSVATIIGAIFKNFCLALLTASIGGVAAHYTDLCPSENRLLIVQDQSWLLHFPLSAFTELELHQNFINNSRCSFIFWLACIGLVSLLHSLVCCHLQIIENFVVIRCSIRVRSLN